MRETETSVAAKYKVSKYPALFLIKTKDGKPIPYEGSDYTYQGVFDFINIYSETFVFRDGEEEVKSAATKPWLSERLPQLATESGNDICFKREGALCVIYIVKDESQKTADTTDLLYNVGQ